MNHKLTPEEVAQLRHLRHTHLHKLKDLAVRFNISTAQVARIASGENWKSVTGSTATASTRAPRNAEAKR